MKGPGSASDADTGVTTKDASSVIAVLAERWPQTFILYERRRRPLKIAIDRDVIAAAIGIGKKRSKPRCVATAATSATSAP